MESVAGDAQRFALKDTEFHRCLGESTHNPLMILLLDSVHALASEVRAFVNRRVSPLDRAVAGHRRIVEGIKSRDRDAARLAMYDHLAGAMQIQEGIVEKVKA
jgi:DNA-binding FadR family transcriptional regulator